MFNSNTRNNKTQKDIALLVPLLLLNLVSGYTTIKGANLALGDIGAAIAVGISVQGILFILLSGWAAKHAPMRKWIAIAVFGFFSVYTSFFTYYDTFNTGDQMLGASMVQAEESHQNIMTTVVNPFLAEYGEVSSEYASLNKSIIREESGEGTTGIAGRGPVARELAERRTALEPELLRLQTIERKIDELKEQAENLESDNPEALFKIDTSIWETLPASYHREEHKPQRVNYFSQSSRYKLLAPMLTLTNTDTHSNREPAVAALIIAAVIDGISILLGTAIEKGKKRTPFEGVTYLLVQTIWGLKKAVKTLFHYLRRPGYRYVSVVSSETSMARDAVYLIKLKLNDRGSDFLSSFLRAVDPVARKIDYTTLQAEKDATVRTGFRLLLEAFRHPSLNWVYAAPKGDEWLFSNADSYAEFCKWLSDEIIYQAEQEDHDGVDYGQTVSAKVVKLRRPLSA